MAKLALVGFGTGSKDSKNHGKNDGLGPHGTGYTYVVNDNVRTGDRLNPVVLHRNKKTVFVTTGRVVATAKNTSTEKGQEMMERQDGEQMDESDLTKIYTGKELGLSGERANNGKFVAEGRSTHDEKGNYIVGRREAAARGGNIMEYEMNRGLKGDEQISEKAQGEVETFKSYSSAFLPTGGKL